MPARRPWPELRVLREKDGLTQAALAFAAGYGQPFISQLESGAKEPTPQVLATLAVALDVPKSVLAKRPGGSIYSDEELTAIVDINRADQVSV